jgi:hypothetical protein
MQESLKVVAISGLEFRHQMEVQGKLQPRVREGGSRLVF